MSGRGRGSRAAFVKGWALARVRSKVGFALCIENTDSEDLERGKVYVIRPDAAAKREGYVRVVRCSPQAESAQPAAADAERARLSAGLGRSEKWDDT